MVSVNSDVLMVAAGIVLSLLAFTEIYSNWKKTRTEAGPSADDDEFVDGRAADGGEQ